MCFSKRKFHSNSPTINSFTDKALYSETTYKYTIVAYDDVGYASEKAEYTVETEKDETGVAWKGFSNGAAFDGDLNTGVSASTQTVTWTPVEKVEGRAISIRAVAGYNNSYNNYLYAYVRNDANQNLTSLSFGETTSTQSFIMPQGTTKIVFNYRYYTGTVYEIYEQ